VVLVSPSTTVRTLSFFADGQLRDIAVKADWARLIAAPSRKAMALLACAMIDVTNHNPSGTSATPLPVPPLSAASRVWPSQADGASQRGA